jgi:hypothetical protein
MHWLLVTAKIVPSSQILITLMMETIRSSETLVLTRATWRNISEEGILHLTSRLFILKCVMSMNTYAINKYVAITTNLEGP